MVPLTLAPTPVRHFCSYGNHWPAHTDTGPAQATTLEGAKEAVRSHFASADAELVRVETVVFGARFLLLAYDTDSTEPGLFIWGPQC